MNLYSVTCTPTAVDADGVCASQSPGAGAITINGALATGGVATITAAGAQKVRITSGGNDGGITFTVTGTDADGNAQSETVAGTSGSNSDTTQYFKTVTGITHTGSVATTIVAGNLITSVSPTFFLTRQAMPARVSASCIVTGTVTYELQDVFSNTKDGQANGTWIQNATVNGKSANFAYAYGDLSPFATRVSISASTAGSVTANFVAMRM